MGKKMIAEKITTISSCAGTFTILYANKCPAIHTAVKNKTLT